MFRSFCLLANEAERLTSYIFILESHGDKDVMLHLEDECTWRRQMPDVIRGVDHFLSISVMRGCFLTYAFV